MNTIIVDGDNCSYNPRLKLPADTFTLTMETPTHYVIETKDHREFQIPRNDLHWLTREDYEALDEYNLIIDELSHTDDPPPELFTRLDIVSQKLRQAWL